MLPNLLQKPPLLQRTGNLLLDLLTAEERQQLLPRAELVPLKIRDVLVAQGGLIDHCYFPISGMISKTAQMKAGDSAEVGLIGREGFVGITVIMGNDHAGTCANVQVAGEAFRVTALDLQAASALHQNFREILLRHANVQFSIITQCSACNALHSAEERLSRWLLMVRDRIGSNDLPLTHELLAQMLGTRRATVTFVAGALERAGLILQTRANIHIVNAGNLQKAACECYGRIRRLEREQEPGPET